MLQQSSEDLKKVLLYLSVNVIDVGQTLRKQVAHPFTAFRGGVIKAFFLGDSLFSGDIEKDARTLWGAGNFNLLEGRGGNRSRQYTNAGPLYSRGHYAVSYPALHVCNWRSQRSASE